MSKANLCFCSSFVLYIYLPDICCKLGPQKNMWSTLVVGRGLGWTWSINVFLFVFTQCLRSPEVEPWVFRWTFSPLSLFPHLQLGALQRRPVCVEKWEGGIYHPLLLLLLVLPLVGRGVWGAGGGGVEFFFLGGGGYCTVDRGSCAVYALLFNLP